MISQEEFADILPIICSAETSSDPDRWVIDNPLYGHCSPIALLAQEFFGGDIVKISLEGTEYSKLISHFLNKIDGEFVDFSKAQFQNDFVYNLDNVLLRDREHIISQGDTLKRYIILKQKLLSKSNL